MELNFKGFDNCETYVVDENTIGVRPKWISVKDRKPDNCEEVLINFGDDCYALGSLVGKRWYSFESRLLKKVTHWMPLPKPPKD